MRLRLPTVLLPAALASVFLTTALPVAPAQAKAGNCKTHSTQITRVGTSTLWTDAHHTTLYGCTSYYTYPPHDEKLGPWTKQSQFSFDGAYAAWTTRGSGTDAVWSADATAKHGTWLKGVHPTIRQGLNRDLVVNKIIVYGEGTAWVTTKGTVMLAVQDPSSDPDLFGSGTPGASVPATTPPAVGTIGNPLGLSLAPVKPQKKLVTVGQWASADQTALAASLQLKIGEGGDGDECGGVDPYDVSVQPIAGQPRVGLEWLSDWVSDSPGCQ